MSQEQFIYWLRGFIAGKEYLCTTETDILREELGKISVIAYSTPIITPLHEPYIKGPSDRDYSTMPMFT